MNDASCHVPFMSPNLRYKLFINITFMSLYNFKNIFNVLMLEFGTYFLILNCITSCKLFKNIYPLQQLYNTNNISFLNYIQSECGC
jgi:hypothetical protein